MDNTKYISVVIPTFNEEANIEKCIRSLEGIDCDIYVVDSNSVDRTAELARALGAQIVTGAWRIFSDKINWSIENLPITTPWTMRLDADETVTDELRRILQEHALNETTHAAYAVRRRFVFLGRWIKHGGMYPSWQVRVWRSGQAKMEVRELDEHMNFSGTLGYLKGDIIDENNKDITFWIDKHNGYSLKEVNQYFASAQHNEKAGFTAQALRRRWIKESLYKHSPLFMRPFVQWFFRYVLLLGFIDGKAGLIYHTLRGFWYPFLIDAKIYEASQRK